MHRPNSTDAIAASPVPEASSPASPRESPTRHHRAVVPQPTSVVTGNGHSPRPHRHRESASKATKQLSHAPAGADAAVRRSRSIASPACADGTARRLTAAEQGTAPPPPTRSTYVPRIIFPYHYRRVWGADSKRKRSSMKAASKANEVTSSNPRTPVSFENSEKKIEDAGRTKPAAETWSRSGRQGARGSNGSLAASSPSASSFNAACRRASSAQTMLSEEVLERLHSLAVEGADKEDVNGLWHDAPWTALAACAVAAVVLIAGLVMWVLLSPQLLRAQRLGNDSSCNSAGCQLLVSEVINRLDMSVDPCEDIEAHVCGAIKWDNALVTDTATQMMRTWMQRGAVYLESKRKREAAFSLYHACMAPAPESVSELKTFMKKRGMSWPVYSDKDSPHALYVLLDLLINWGVPFWFELSLRRLPNNTRYSMYVNRVPMNKWRRQQQLSDDHGHLREYADMFYGVYGASEVDRSHIDRLLQLEKDMHAVIEPPLREDHIQPGALTELQVPLRSSTVFTPRFDSNMWLGFLNELLRPHQFTLEDYILIDDMGLSLMITEFLAKFSNKDMLYTLGWWFAQQFSVMASLDGSVASYGSIATAAANRHSDCYALAESRFQRQLFLQRAHASLGTEGMRQVADLLGNIQNTTMTLLSSLPWMDEDARTEAVAIVKSTELDVWERHLGNNKPSDFGSQESLPTTAAPVGGSGASGALQAGSGTEANGTWNVTGGRLSDVRPGESAVQPLPRMGERGGIGTSQVYASTVVQAWMEAAIRYKRRVTNWPLDDSLMHRHLSYSMLAHYDYWWNSVFVQMGALAEPLFYLGGPPSANYGGIGVLVARQFFKAYDYMRGSQLDASRKKRRWMLDSTMDSYERKLACVEYSSQTMEHVAAVEVAHAAAFGRAARSERHGETTPTASEKRSDWLPGYGRAISPEMVFFLVYCRSTCEYRNPGGFQDQRKGSCNDVLKRMAAFRQAFGCPADSKMTSPLPKCSFFGK